MASQVKDLKLKTIIVGDSGVGKTSIMHRFCRRSYSTQPVTTGLNFESTTLQVLNRTVTFHIFDTAGQEKHFAISKMYFRNVHCVVFVYDVTRPESLFNMERWFCLVEKEACPEVIKVLVGHKCDSQKLISETEGKAVADYYKMFFVEASSKENRGVDSIFNFLATEAVSTKHSVEFFDHQKNGFVLTSENNSNQSNSSYWFGNC